jgi:dethiobiotin synthetase
MTALFITGTDTGIGKTYATVLLVQQLIAHGYRVAALKPVASGADLIDGGLRNEDALQLQRVSNVPLSYDEVNPYCLAEPISPHLAAAAANVCIDFAIIEKQLRSLQSRADVILVEGVGGWLAPLRDDATIADLVCSLRLPVILVVGLRLGCLNHAVLSARAIVESGIELAGWIANAIDASYSQVDASLLYLRTHIAAPLMGLISHNGTTLQQQNVSLFSSLGKNQKT